MKSSIVMNIIKVVQKPFKENLEMLIVLCLYAGAADGFFWTCHAFERPEINKIFGVYMFLHSFVLTYAIVCLCGFLKGNYLKIVRMTLYILGFLNLCIDTAIHIIMKCGFIKDFVAIIMGTNFNESSEFLGMYFNGKMVLFVAVISSLICIVHFCFSKKRNISNRFALCGLILFMASTAVIVGRKSENWDGVFLMKIKTCLEYKTTPDLHQYSKVYELTKKEKIPSDFVLIIGESLNKDHMSLYGYEKNTTPLLDELKNSDNLYIFDQVKSSGIGTVPAFMYMMTSLTREKANLDWSNEDFLLDIVKSAGYNVQWISNQASAGIHDNIVARLAELSDSVVWCGTKHMGPSKIDLDEDVYDPVLSRRNNIDSLCFTVVHLCGNHENFRSRYSEEYERFHAADYSSKPANQRQILSEYDNSVLYNDWIVSSIIDMYKGKNAIVVYLPDHSIDIFNSSEDYAGHARGNDPRSVEAGKNIPFIIYLSHSLKEQEPELDAMLRKSLHNSFETENLMFAIMDLIGIDFRGDRKGEVVKKTLFSK